jgi:hypothetical protein
MVIPNPSVAFRANSVKNDFLERFKDSRKKFNIKVKPEIKPKLAMQKKSAVKKPPRHQRLKKNGRVLQEVFQVDSQCA